LFRSQQADLEPAGFGRPIQKEGIPVKILSRLSAVVLLSLAFSAHGQVSINSGDLYGIDVDGNQLIRYDPSTGTVLESVGLPSRTYVGLTITDGRVFAAVVNGEIYEVDPQTGSTILLFSSSASENLGRYGSNLIFVNFGSGVFTETQTDGTTVRTGSPETDTFTRTICLDSPNYGVCDSATASISVVPAGPTILAPNPRRFPGLHR
jgi:hypothetical protein